MTVSSNPSAHAYSCKSCTERSIAFCAANASIPFVKRCAASVMRFKRMDERRTEVLLKCAASIKIPSVVSSIMDSSPPMMPAIPVTSPFVVMRISPFSITNSTPSSAVIFSSRSSTTVISLVGSFARL